MSKLLSFLFNKYIKPPAEENGQLKLATTVVTVLTLFRSWPKESAKSQSPIGDKFFYVLFFFYCNIIVFGLWGHILRLYFTTGINYDDIGIDLALLSLGVSGYKYCSALYGNRHLAKKLLDEMGDFRKYEKPPGIELVDAVLNGIYRSFIVGEIILTPVLLALLLPETCEEDDYDCGLVYPAYVPGFMTSHRRKLFVVVQLTSAWSYALLGSGCSWVAMHMTEYLILYLKHCQTIIRRITTIEDFHERKSFVRYVVQYHHRILFLYNDYKELVGGIFVVHAISTPLFTALMVHTFIVNFQVQCFLIFAIWTTIFFVVCFMGQRMVNESAKLARVVYESIPLDGDVVTAKMMIFVLQQAQQPLITPAGSLTFCGYGLFAAVLKTAYSYLALIQNTSSTKAE